MKLGELAAQLGCTLEGDGQVEVHGVAGIEEARAGEVTFLSNPKYARELAATSASAVGRSTALRRSGRETTTVVTFSWVSVRTLIAPSSHAAGRPRRARWPPRPKR